MKRLKQFGGALLCLFLLLPGLCLAQNTIRLTVGEWPPYVSEKLEHGGMLLEAIAEAFELEGIKVEYEFLPWKRALLYVEDGTSDGSAGWTKTPEREKLFYFCDPIFEGQGVFFHLKSDPFAWKTIKDLKNIRIGGTIGYNYGEAVQKAEKSGVISMERVPTDTQNFKKLLAGRIRIFPQLLQVGYSQLQQDFSAEDVKLVTHHPTPYRTALYYLLLSRKNPKNEQIALSFNRSLQRLKASGRFDEIFRVRPPNGKPGKSGNKPLLILK